MSASLLGLLSIQSGQISNPSTQDGATGGSSLDVDQRACELGAPVPIVFARRRNDKGGILIAPGATEARFENDEVNAVTAYYHLVISEGEIDSIPVKDVFQRACRLGSHTQTYGRRAGLWLPGNYIVERAGYDKPEASSYCGSVGVYSQMSTLSFQSTIPDGFDQWRKQVHLFIRGGMYVTRLFDSVTGPSDNFADLVLWILQNSNRVPAALIDQPALLNAAKFLEANGLTCNVEIKEATNILDFIANWAPYFLLGESNNNGKKGLRPLLPTNADGTLKTTAISVEYTFDESLIIPDSFSIEYINYADRLPFVAQLTWRQELGTDAAIVRTSEVRFSNTSAAGPFESYDLSAFCTSEDHAVKVGAYIVVRRATVTHNILFTAKPEAHNTILSPGSIVRVIFARDSNSDAPSVHNYSYRVERITKTLTGEVGYECSHFPVDSEGRSIISLYVASTVGNGALFTTNQTGVTCDLPGREDDLTIPEEEFMLSDDLPGWTWDPDADTWIPDDDIPGWTYDPETDDWVLDPLEPFPDPEPGAFPDFPSTGGGFGFDPSIDLPPPTAGAGEGIGEDDGDGANTELSSGAGSGTYFYGGGGSRVTTNPKDKKGNQSTLPTRVTITTTGNPEAPAVGDTASVDSETICAGGVTNWYRQSPAGTPVPVDPNDNGGILIAQAQNSYTFVIDDVDYAVWAEVSCPDPTSPTGYSEPASSPWILPVRSIIPGFENITFTGSYSPTGTTTFTRTGNWKGRFLPDCNTTQFSGNGSGTITGGLVAMRYLPSGAAYCSGTNNLDIQGQKADGTWFGMGGISGGIAGLTGWESFEGAFVFNTTAGDALPAGNLQYE